MIRTTIIGGIFFLIPVAFLAYMLAKAYQLSLLIAGPIDKIFPFDAVFGDYSQGVLAVIVILIVCFIAGLVAKMSFIADRVKALDAILIDIIPGYAVAKSTLRGASRTQDVDEVLKSVLVQFDDHELIAFEVERSETHSTVFLPGAPSAWAGSTVIVPLERVTPLNLPTNQVSALLRVLGRGSLKAISANR